METETKKNQHVKAVTQKEHINTVQKNDNYEPVGRVNIEMNEKKDENKCFKGIKSNK